MLIGQFEPWELTCQQIGAMEQLSNIKWLSEQSKIVMQRTSFSILIIQIIFTTGKILILFSFDFFFVFWILNIFESFDKRLGFEPCNSYWRAIVYFRWSIRNVWRFHRQGKRFICYYDGAMGKIHQAANCWLGATSSSCIFRFEWIDWNRAGGSFTQVIRPYTRVKYWFNA